MAISGRITRFPISLHPGFHQDGCRPDQRHVEPGDAVLAIGTRLVQTPGDPPDKLGLSGRSKLRCGWLMGNHGVGAFRRWHVVPLSLDRLLTVTYTVPYWSYGELSFHSSHSRVVFAGGPASTAVDL